MSSETKSVLHSPDKAPSVPYLQRRRALVVPPEEILARIDGGEPSSSTERVLFHAATEKVRRILAMRDPTKTEVININTPKRIVTTREAYLNAFRQEQGMTRQTIAKCIGIRPDTYSRVESRGGQIAPETATKITEFLDEYVKADDPKAIIISAILKKEVDEKDIRFQGVMRFSDGEIIDSRSDEQKWYTTIQKSSVTEAIQLLWLDSSLSFEDFSARMGVSAEYLDNVVKEKGIVKPGPELINKVIDASSLKPDDKAAQLLRLKNRGKAPMTLEELKNASIGELLRYLRHALGATREELEPKFLRSRMTISRIETSSYKDTEYLPYGLEDDVLKWLKPSDALASVIQQKINHPQRILPQKILQEAVTDKYLFVDTERQTNTTILMSNSVRKVYSQLEKCQTFGNMLSVLRNKSNLTLSEVGAKIYNSPYAKSYVSAFEYNKRLPNEELTWDMLNVFGYDIHHPITHIVWKRLQEEKRKVHKSKGRKKVAA